MPIESKGRKQVFDALHNTDRLNKRNTLPYTAILKILGYSGRSYHLNYNMLEGNRTYFTIFNALKKQELNNLTNTFPLIILKRKFPQAFMTSGI